MSAPSDLIRYAMTHKFVSSSMHGSWLQEPFEPPPPVRPGVVWYLNQIATAAHPEGVLVICTWQAFL